MMTPVVEAFVSTSFMPAGFAPSPNRGAYHREGEEGEYVDEVIRQLIQTLLANDLIDVFTLLTFPVVLGSGKRLFGKGAKLTGMKLVETKASTTGVIMSTYVRRLACNLRRHTPE